MDTNCKNECAAGLVSQVLYEASETVKFHKYVVFRNVRNADDKIEDFQSSFKAVVRACYRAYLVAHVFKYLAPNFVSAGETCMMLFFRISVQLSVEPLISHAVCNSQHA